MDPLEQRIAAAVQREKHLKDLLWVIRRINRLIVSERDSQQLIEAACKHLTGIDAYHSAMIVLLDDQQAHTSVACACTEPTCDALLERVRAGFIPNCVTQALTQNETCITSGECNSCPLACFNNGRVGLSGRLQWGDQIYGVMTVSMDEALSQDPEERDLFDELLGDIAFALHRIEAERNYERGKRELMDSEERFHMLARYSPQIIYLCRNDSKYSMLFLNEAIETITGFSKDLFLSGHKAFTSLFHPDDKNMIDETIAQGLKKNRPFKISYRIIRKDGSICWVEEHGGLIHLANGDILLVGTILDVTDRRENEIERELLSTAIEQLAETVVITDSTGTIQYVNAGFEQSTGYPREEAIGNNPRMLQSGKQDKAFYKDMWQTLLRGDVWSGRLFNRRKDGAEYEEEAIISPIRDAMGKITHYVGVKRDVTLEHSLQNQLLQSQKMEAVGLLAGGIAHDFNNLLTVIMSAAGFVRTTLAPSSQAREDADEIISAAARAAELTRQLLAFSRRQIMVPKDVDLNEILSGMENMLRRLIPENIHFTFTYHDEPLRVRVDTGQIEQVILNLIVNARDAINGAGHIQIQTTQHIPVASQHARYVEPPERWGEAMAAIRVTDTGSGIPTDVLPRIFEPFYTTKPVGEGTGLGLSTVLGIVRQHHGTVSVDNRMKEGATFCVYLPLIPADAAESPSLGRDMLWGGSETLLVVEDDSGVRQVIMRLLSGLGYQILTAPTGADALSVARNYEGPIHALLTDMIMPGLNGVEVAEQVQLIRPGIKVLFASGYPEAHLTQAGIEVGKRTLIRKPFNRADLSRAIRELLDRRDEKTDRKPVN